MIQGILVTRTCIFLYFIKVRYNTGVIGKRSSLGVLAAYINNHYPVSLCVCTTSVCTARGALLRAFNKYGMVLVMHVIVHASYE